MRNFMRKLHAQLVTPNLQNWASLCLNSYLFSFCSDDCPQGSLSASVFARVNVRCFTLRALWWRTSGGDESSPGMAVRPASALERCISCSSPPPPPLPRCCCCQPWSRCTALHRAVTKLDDALPHGLQHRCESRSSTPAPHQSNRPSRSASRRRLPLRGALCTQLLPARQSQRQPVGVHAAGPDHQLRANFPGARAARSASSPRSGARRKNWAWWGTGRTRFATEVDTKVFYGENLFCRQSRETCESGLRSRRSRSDYH